ncbi:phosphatidylcholine/phosphatidylserine synthase [uncultured Ruminococcus sp.]|uniref:CDP-alcohol phosphatidyltransferase family protein n=1 Tax=uncultured Ruminococcus sp. TaxID=165186 RepID=UPI000EBD714A|nr:CDP-alcohol phosphatidyltransferase family protein [uncultured Ruminococcus sp.]HCJ42233.1 CDP-diacylglycerol--serine O-phosphatidyltransferase [Ruminococcus sp.]
MIGFYNYSVILTYIGLLSSVFGITQVFEGHDAIAFFCLVASGICDLFDGKIARSMKNRTDHEKVFGIQIDSLCDLVCFGVFPAVLGYHYQTAYPMRLIPAMMIVLAAVIRLGYFNVMEEERQRETTENRKEYEGLPVTSVCIVLPLLYIGRHNIPAHIFPYVFQGFLMLISILFVAKIKVNKPSNKGLLIMFTLGLIIFFSYLKMNHII